MNLKVAGRTLALTLLVGHSVAFAAQQPSPNVELVASGLEEYVGGKPSDRATLKIYQGEAKQALHTVEFNPRAPIKKLKLPAASYRLSFESNEPDAEGGTACSANGELKVAANQQYRVAFTAIKRFCVLSTGTVAANGDYQQIASVDGKMRRLQPKQ